MYASQKLGRSRNTRFHRIVLPCRDADKRKVLCACEVTLLCRLMASVKAWLGRARGVSQPRTALKKMREVRPILHNTLGRRSRIMEVNWKAVSPNFARKFLYRCIGQDLQMDWGGRAGERGVKGRIRLDGLASCLSLV